MNQLLPFQHSRRESSNFPSCPMRYEIAFPWKMRGVLAVVEGIPFPDRNRNESCRFGHGPCFLIPTSSSTFRFLGVARLIPLGKEERGEQGACGEGWFLISAKRCLFRGMRQVLLRLSPLPFSKRVEHS